MTYMRDSKSCRPGYGAPQRLGGGLMLLEGSIAAFAVAGWLIVQVLREESVRPATRNVSPSA